METTIGGSSILFVGFTLRLKGISHDFSNTSERRGVHCSGGGCLEVRNGWLKTNTWVLERSGRCFKRIGSSLSIEDHPKCRKTHRKSKTTRQPWVASNAERQLPRATPNLQNGLHQQFAVGLLEASTLQCQTVSKVLLFEFSCLVQEDSSIYY